MRMNIDAIKTLELKLAEYSKENGVIAEHASESLNYHEVGCNTCVGKCTGTCDNTCAGSCKGSKH